jgi:MFS family permease
MGRHPARTLAPVLIFVGTVVAVISSLGAPLVPAIAAAHSVSVTTAQWSLTITMLVGAVATPVLGRLGDGRHRRRVMLAILGLVVLGSAMAALRLPFGWLLAGRALQGFGLGLTPLAIATAQESLAGEHGQRTAAALSITVVAGVGLGYPITGLVAELGGVHGAFWFGAAISAIALGAAAAVLPVSRAMTVSRLDVVGAVLLGSGLAAGVFVLSEGELWGWGSVRTLALTAIAVLALVGWVGWELRTDAPLVDVHLARGRPAATAHSAALLVGVGNYLLLSSVALLAQTPPSSGYGFGASVVVSGLVLLPFSAASVVAGRLTQWVVERAGTRAVLPGAALILEVAFVVFLIARGSLWELFVAMTVAGLGVGAAFAVLPRLVASAVPAGETSSAMGLNQVLRYVGYAAGSAATAAILAAASPAGSGTPSSHGYAEVAVVGCVLCLAMAVLTWLLPGATVRSSEGRAVPRPAAQLDRRY